MVRSCCAVRCNVRSHDRQENKLKKGLSFHSFPTWKQHEGAHVSDVTKRRRLAWIAAVRRADIHKCKLFTWQCTSGINLDKTLWQPVLFANTCVCTNDCRKVLFYNHWFIQ
uniref:THAP-type domain-containing protein n=1 Tax=Maylandia zebra TaxID=106582 RepID=A0A3P9DC19_9CICH